MKLGEDEVAAAWDANAATWVAHVRAGYDRYRELFSLPAFLAFIPDLAFDAAVSTMALMDSPDFAAAAGAVHRVLRPDGGFWFSVLHPCFVTPGLQWQRDAAGNETGLTVADYFSERSYVERWRFTKAPETSTAEPFHTPRFPRRLEDYVNGLCAAAFRIARIAEPRPTPAVCSAHPWLARWRRHAALIVLIGAIKA